MYSSLTTPEKYGRERYAFWAEGKLSKLVFLDVIIIKLGINA